MIRIKLNEIKVMNEGTGKFEKKFRVVETHNLLQWILSNFGDSWIDHEFETRELAEICIKSCKKKYWKSGVKIYREEQ